MRVWRGLVAGLLAATGALLGCGPDRSAAELPTAAEMLALLKRGGGPNVAVTAPNADDPLLRPHAYPGRASEIARPAEHAITPLPRWEVIAGRNGVIWLTRRTRLGFTDDIYLLLLPTGDSTVVLARSASRVGRYDLGQNRRNLGELWRALERQTKAEHRTDPRSQARTAGTRAASTPLSRPHRPDVAPDGLRLLL